MDDAPTPQQRIAAAVARIERAVADRADAAAELAQRHTMLRARLAEAIDAIDQLLAQGGGGSKG